MKNLRMRKCSFFKIMFGETIWEKMRIPPKFSSLFATDFASAATATLVGPSGRSWTAKIVHDNCNVYLKSGWQEFLMDNLVKENEMLTFTYLENMNFSVQVFDDCGMERTNMDFFEEICDSDSAAPEEEESYNDSGQEDQNEVMEEDTSLSCPPTNLPYFSINIEPCNTGYDGYVIVPNEFAKKFLTGESTLGTLVEHDDWRCVVEFRNENNQWFIMTGWPDFALRKELDLMDSCLFELVEPKKIVLKVSVVRKFQFQWWNTEPRA